jgi:hypothetical protein
MVYGLMRVEALAAAGVFRPVLNPDRMLIAELTLHGEVRQVPEPLWWRRQGGSASVVRQRTSLFADAAPPYFGWPSPLQHVMVWHRHGIPRSMLRTYLLASMWRAMRKTETSKSLGRGVDNVHYAKKLVKKAFHVSVYYMLVSGRVARGKMRRGVRRAIYEVLTFTHRMGLRGGTNTR